MIVVETSRMTLFKASSIKKQNLSRERIKVKKFSTDIVLVFITITAYMLLFGAPVNEAVVNYTIPKFKDNSGGDRQLLNSVSIL